MSYSKLCFFGLNSVEISSGIIEQNEKILSFSSCALITEKDNDLRELIDYIPEETYPDEER